MLASVLRCPWNSRLVKATESPCRFPAGGNTGTRRNSKSDSNSQFEHHGLYADRDTSFGEQGHAYISCLNLECKATPIPDIGQFKRNADADDAMLQHFSGRAGSADPNATSASVVPETVNVRLSLKTGFPGRRHILSKFGIKPFARCRASSLRRQRLLTGPDGPPVTVRAFSRQQDAYHPSTITLMLR